MEQLNEKQEVEKENPTSKSKEMCVDVRVWDHFTPLTNKIGRQRTKCLYCHRTYIVDPARNENGTPAINYHVRFCEKNPDSESNKKLQDPCPCFSVIGDSNKEEEEDGEEGEEEEEEEEGEEDGEEEEDEEEEEEVGEEEVGEEEEYSDSGRVFDVKAAQKSLARMMIIDQNPFYCVEGEGFKNFMSALCPPQFVIPPKLDLAKACYKLYIVEKNKLKAYFRTSGQRVSLSVDTWTSNRDITYMCLTSHYIDDSWKLHRKILNFVSCCFNEGEEFGSLIVKCLAEWGIDGVFTIIAENASSDETADYLRRKFVDWGTGIMEGNFLRAKCISHILHVVVIDELNELVGPIGRVRDIVRYLRVSPFKIYEFEEFAAEQNLGIKKRLCLDDPTRWDSTYKMLETAVSLKDAFGKYEAYDFDSDDDDIQLPTETDWVVVERFVNVLRYFYELTLRVSNSSTVTANSFLDEITELDNLFREWISSDDGDLVGMARKMKLKFDEYWGDIERMNLMVYVAVMLDPRYKFIHVEHIFKEMHGDEHGARMANMVKNAFFDVFKEYERLYPNDEGDDDMRLVNEENKDESECGDNFVSVLGVKRDRKKKYMRMLCKMGRANKSELDVYLYEHNEKDDSDFDVVEWWKMSSSRFPVLSRLARDVLAMPVSTRNLKCAFSTETPQISDYRARLPEGFIQALVCGHDWLSNGPEDPVDDEYDETGADAWDLFEFGNNL